MFHWILEVRLVRQVLEIHWNRVVRQGLGAYSRSLAERYKDVDNVNQIPDDGIFSKKSFFAAL